MFKFTKKWDDYINKEWNEFLNTEEFNVVYPDKLYDGEFNDSLLEEEFEKYYNAKKKYVSLYDYFEKEFDSYEKIKLLSREEEYQIYVDRFNSLIQISIDRFREMLNSNKKSILNDYAINDIDFRLLVLGKINLMTRDIYRKSMSSYETIMKSGDDTFKYNPLKYFKSINKFLTSYDEFYQSFQDKTGIKNLRECWFHDTTIVSCVKDDNNIILNIDLNYNSNKSIKLIFKNASINMDIKMLKNGIDIYSGDARYYDDVGCYLSLDLLFDDRVVITSDDLEFFEYYTDELLEQYNWLGDMYQENLNTVKNKLSENLLGIFHMATEENWLTNSDFEFVTPVSYSYDNNNLVINYESFLDSRDTKCSLWFNDVFSISIFNEEKVIAKKDFYLYFEELAGNIYNDTNGNVKYTGKELLEEILKLNMKMKIKDRDGLFEVGLFIIEKVEIIIVCSDINFINYNS